MIFLRRLRRLTLATLMTLLVTGSLAAPAAHAATAMVDNGAQKLVYTGSSEANNVTVSSSGSTYTVSDSGAAISPGFGCAAAGPGKVTCTSNKVNRIDVSVNGGDDTVTINGPVRSVLNGSTGNDRLVGGSSWDWLSGGTGDDSLDGRGGPDAMYGGDGVDTVDYSARTAALKITQNGGYWYGDDGEAGEYDNVGSDVETIVGGSGNDTITGNSVKNTLKGGPGDDKLYGVAGDDILEGGPGSDVLDAGDGADLLHARDGAADQLACGAGSDAGEADSIDTVGSDCEGFGAPGGGAGPAGNSPQTTLDYLPARVRVTQRGKLRLRIVCPEQFGSCEGTLSIIPLDKAKASASKRTSKAIGRGTYKVRGGETKVINVKLSRNGRRRVLRNKRLKCNASSVTRAGSGRKVTVRKKITLEAPRRKK
jgi:hypothetical protein